MSPLFLCTLRPVPRIPFAGGRDELLGSLQPRKMWFLLLQGSDARGHCIAPGGGRRLLPEAT